MEDGSALLRPAADRAAQLVHPRAREDLPHVREADCAQHALDSRWVRAPPVRVVVPELALRVESGCRFTPEDEVHVRLEQEVSLCHARDGLQRPQRIAYVV